MKKLLVIASVVALAFGGVGFALGMTTGAHADHGRSPTASAPVRAPVPVTHTPRTEAPRAEAPRPEAPRTVTRDTEPVAAPSVRVRRLVVTSGIEDREPVDTLGTTSVGEHERVYAFLELANRGGAGSVIVTFERDGATPTGQVELEVPGGAGRWRTWAFTRGITHAGEWRAVVRDEDGRVLAEQAFVVE